MVEVTATDDLQKILDVLKIQVTEANEQSEEDFQKKLKIRRELEDLQKKRENSTQKFMDDTDHLKF